VGGEATSAKGLGLGGEVGLGETGGWGETGECFLYRCPVISIGSQLSYWRFFIACVAAILIKYHNQIVFMWYIPSQYQSQEQNRIPITHLRVMPVQSHSPSNPQTRSCKARMR
jgi:hypothetical protein